MKSRLLTIFLLLVTCSLHANNGTKEYADNVPVATFAGGNFWYMQQELDRLLGVMHSQAGYAGGVTVFPTYEQVSTGHTKHVETIQIVYSPELLSYEELLDIYFKNIDPIDPYGQFCHKGTQYMPKIFYHTEAQKLAAQKKIEEMRIRFKGDFVVVQLLPYTIFYPAEDEYQMYAKRRPFFYRFMEFRCGRIKGLKKIWGED